MVVVQVIWDDGNSDDPRPLRVDEANATLDTVTHRHVATFTHVQGYREGDDFNVTVIIWNLVSNETVEFAHSLYEEIIDLAFGASRLDETDTPQPGFGPSEDNFRMEEPVQLEATMTRGSHLTFQWNFGDGSPSQALYDNPAMAYTYSAPGTYTVQLFASNRLNEASYSIVIIIQRSISPSLALHTNTPWPSNNTFNFDAIIANASLADFATEACYRLYFGGDVNATGAHLYFFGDMMQCRLSFPVEEEGFVGEEETDNPFIIEEIPMSDAEWSSATLYSAYLGLVLQTHYMTVGEWFTTLTGVNIVSSRTAELRVVTTKGPCYHPTVDINSVNLCTPGANCHPTLNIPTFYRAETVLLGSRVRFNCTTSFVSSNKLKLKIHF